MSRSLMLLSNGFLKKKYHNPYNSSNLTIKVKLISLLKPLFTGELFFFIELTLDAGTNFNAIPAGLIITSA